jgi:hypothetical protein
MGVHMLIQIRAHSALSQYSARLASSQPARTSLTSWPKRDEKRLAQHTRVPPNLEPGVQRAARLLRDRNDAFLAALPHDANLACAQLEISDIQGNHLADTNSGAVEQLDQGTITKRHPLQASLTIAALRRGLIRNPAIVCNELFTIVDGKRMG